MAGTRRPLDQFPAHLLPGRIEHYFRATAAGDEETSAAVSGRFGYRPVESSS
jgi:hypothetical protein